MTAAPSLLRVAAARLFGLFAVWQVLFPLLANAFEFVPLRPIADDRDLPLESTQRWGRFTDSDAVQSAAEGVGYALAWYGQFTGQEHGWDMFTPGFPPYTVVPFAEAAFPGGRTDRRFSRFDPIAFRQPWLRPLFLNNREFNHEANLFMLAWHFDPTRSPDAAGQPDLVLKVRENDELIGRWLRWRARQFGNPPEVRLVLRFIPMNGDDAVELPFARWRPHEPTPPKMQAVEAYNPKEQRFVWVPVWDSAGE